MDTETTHHNGNADSRESSVERELNEEVQAVELNSSSDSPKDLNGLMKKPLPVGDGHDRIKRRAKRLIHRQNSRGETNGAASAALAAAISAGSAGSYVVPHRRWKNSRRSRNGHGRGLPKKGGAGGKGVWGLPGSEALEEVYEDENDPNYDSECNDKNIELREVIPEVTPEEFFKLAEPIVLEYYEHGDTHEVAVSFDEILTGPLRPHVTSVVVEISMDHKDSQREMTSVLISDLYGRVITAKDIERGFEILLDNLPDLTLDTPDAPTILGNFLARAVADDCLPPKFVTKPTDLDAQNQLAIAAIRRADTLLHMKQGWAHLDNVWGMGGPLRPVKTITKEMTLLLKEYLSSRDIQEAHRCLRALEVPHFHHELVYEAIVMTLESLSQTTEEAMCELLKSLDEACLVLPAGMEQGFLRVFDDMADIVLDVPLAYIILDRFVERCNRAGFITDKILSNMPSRGRKRFVSEGDGGHIKPQTIPIRD
ncbi:programmed cell death protein 4 [Ceratitis capitata]|uniref:Programmed cell death protein 4 n=1 Tax=Ceratitis capitata TaxID=7213 RepID=W8AY20_CERCA|nr:programmed cell death protein 4 [Ceratitis capitata]XP_004524872.1 programmed cell death protein 4 [Ceratitis capitata]XP_004524873.1 programmed cell death protein 4 [Ceratitis capitata]